MSYWVTFDKTSKSFTCIKSNDEPGTEADAWREHHQYMIECEEKMKRQYAGWITSAAAEIDRLQRASTELPCDSRKEELSVDECVKAMDKRWGAFNWTTIPIAVLVPSGGYVTRYAVDAGQPYSPRRITETLTLEQCLRAAVENVEGKEVT